MDRIKPFSLILKLVSSIFRWIKFIIYVRFGTFYRTHYIIETSNAIPRKDGGEKIDMLKNTMLKDHATIGEQL